MSAIDIACRRCLAQAGEECYWPSRTLGVFHAERVMDASAMTRSAGAEPTTAELEKAIDATGLF